MSLSAAAGVATDATVAASKRKLGRAPARCRGRSEVRNEQLDRRVIDRDAFRAGDRRTRPRTRRSVKRPVRIATRDPRERAREQLAARRVVRLTNDIEPRRAEYERRVRGGEVQQHPPDVRRQLARAARRAAAPRAAPRRRERSISPIAPACARSSAAMIQPSSSRRHRRSGFADRSSTARPRADADRRSADVVHRRRRIVAARARRHRPAG